MSVLDDTRNWGEYIGRWRRLLDDLKDEADFLTWYAEQTTELDSLEESVEALEQKIDRAYKAFLNKAGS